MQPTPSRTTGPTDSSLPSARASYVTAARDTIIRLAATPAHRGDLESASAEMAQRPGWQKRPEAVSLGLELARALVAQHGGAKAAERALDGKGGES